MCGCFWGLWISCVSSRRQRSPTATYCYPQRVHNPTCLTLLLTARISWRQWISDTASTPLILLSPLTSSSNSSLFSFRFFFHFFNSPPCVSLCFHGVSRNSDGPTSHLHSTNGHPMGMPPPMPVDGHSYYSNAAMVGVPHPHHPDCPNSLNCLPDTNEKPNHILPVIVRSAILGSPKQKLTIREIYKAIESKFPYFRTTEVNWKVRICTFGLCFFFFFVADQIYRTLFAIIYPSTNYLRKSPDH